MSAPTPLEGSLTTALTRLPDEVRHAITMFNRRRFDECHHELQAVWYRERDPIRLLYQGIVQIGAAALHVERRHWRQALILFDRARPKLAACPAVFLGIDVARLRAAAARCEAAIRDAGPEGVHAFGTDAFPTIELDGDRPAA
jgi:predicted metal-dependent hydrolase